MAGDPLLMESGPAILLVFQYVISLGVIEQQWVTYAFSS